MESTVEAWFGEDFGRLHPLLQRLHREGGTLSGPVEVCFGRGLAGRLGRRLAERLGVPAVEGTHPLRVTIRSDAGALHWGRRFEGMSGFDSKFLPVGRYPTGHWLERSGRLSLALGVEIRDGGWHWTHRKTRVFGMPVPGLLFPTTLASKRIEGDRYHFSVEIRAPALGKLLGYSGTLTAASAANS